MNIVDLIKLGIDDGLIKIVEGNRISYTIQGKSYNFSDPEEKIRAATYVKLVKFYKYPPNRIDFEVEPPQREPKQPADIVVFEDDSHEKAFIVVECKPGSSEEELQIAKKEGLGNANLLNAKYLLVVCADKEYAYDVSTHPSTWKSLDKYLIPQVPVQYGRPPKYRYKKGELFFDLQEVSLKDLRSVFRRCHNLLWEGGKRDPTEAFDEMSKLMFAKIYDETFTKVGDYYRFQIGLNEDPKSVADRIRKLYEEVRESEPDVFGDPIKVSDEIIYEVCKVLQGISLTKTDLDAKGRAFEEFLGKIFRGDFGQYFTPREIVEFMVKFIDPDFNELIIDPACGSGGFLLYSIKHIMDKAIKAYGKDPSREIIWSFSHNNVFGIEINDKIARIAMMDMKLHGDGHTNIECNDALDDFEKFDKRKDIRPNKYHVLLTNPPFGSKIKRSVKHYFVKYELSKNDKGKLKPSEMSEILFIERSLDLLRPGGRMGIILPDSAFTNKNNIRVVKYIMSRAKVLAVISLPEHAFVPFGSQPKTSILFLEKLRDGEDIEDYPIFMAHIENIGYDSTGRADRNDLPEVLKEWEKFKQDSSGYPSHKHVSSKLWFTKVMSSQVGTKLDVEAYGKEYVDILNKINLLKAQGFIVAPLKDITTDIFPGIGPKKDDYIDTPRSGIPIIKTASIRKIKDRIGIIEWDKVSFVNRSKYRNSKKFLQKYDILLQSVAHSKRYIGDKIAIISEIPEKYKKVLALSKFLILRPDINKVDPYYLYLYLLSEFGQIQIKHYIRGMSAEIYKFDIENLLVVLPPRSTQEEIASKFLETIDEVHRLEYELENKKDQLKKLLQVF
ncbi:N-6 DNA methylase [Palaeococcus ferrophilus]|uniref:N-6 DNA methylase n=1 Tax=Palaeococcus ferrophilus TaxID=83868 RepID=UPI00069900E2|nr:N-6 DNA methylase [Palaeococcus ferrophilus]